MSSVRNDLKGVFTALITPFKSDEVDYDSLSNLLIDQERQGVDGYVINGTTAESPNLSVEEVKSIFHFVRKQVGAEKPLILGTGSNSTRKTIEFGKLAEELGAQASLVVVPYYNKPPQRGLQAHFEKVADASKLPIILYNVPGRTITSLSAETAIALSSHPNIIGIKEASGNMETAKELAENTKDFLLLSGDDGSYADFLRVGGQGVISVSSHLIGAEMKQWTQKLTADPKAELDVSRWNTFLKLLGIESNPIPLKMALYLKGIIATPELRLPLVRLNEEHVERLKAELSKLGIL